MVVAIDRNPYSVTEDIFAEEGDIQALAKEVLESGEKPELDLDNGEHIRLKLGRKHFNLRVRRVLGGNQYNVSQNLEVMKKWTPGLIVENHDALKDAQGNLRVVRKSLYLPDIKEKIDLVNPQELGEIIFEKDLTDKNIMISSSPHGKMGEAYWEAFREFLLSNSSSKFYWNPGRVQINGNLDREILELMRGRVSIMQMNESEARTFMANYLTGERDLAKLSTVTNSDWTVITQGEKGLTVYTDGKAHEQEAVKFPLRGQGNDVGCGDLTLSTFIAYKEAAPGTPLKAVALAASINGGLQYSNKNPNLADYKSVDAAQAAK